MPRLLPQHAKPLLKKSMEDLTNPTEARREGVLGTAGRWYRQMTGKLLDRAVQPRIFGELPEALLVHQQPVAAQQPAGSRPVCYVILQASTPDALLVEGEARRQQLPRPLEQIDCPLLDERAALISLLPGADRDDTRASATDGSPRLLRLIDALARHPELDIDLVPVTVLWGRAPDKEAPLWRLLLDDAFAPPTMLRQSLNILIHRRDTFVQFHPALSLRELLADMPSEEADRQARQLQQALLDYLYRQREVVTGPDLSDRRNLVNTLVDTPALQQVISEQASTGGKSYDKVVREARGYLEEIVTDYSHTAVLFLESSLEWLWTQLFDGLEVFNFNEVRELADTHEIVYVPCHRSHMDYLLLSFVVFQRGMIPPYVAAGNNLDIPVVGPLLRRAGAFYIRRSFRDNPLYGAVLREYVHSMLERNHPIEYFVEGGRSRSGRLLPPKTGMLAMTVRSQLRRGIGKPVVFIPTYIGYERLMEASTYVGEMQGKPKESESLLSVLKSVRKIERIFGKVYLNFGEPVFLDHVETAFGLDQLPPLQGHEAMPEEAKPAIAMLADTIMRNINRAAVINPVSLLALVLLSTPKHALDESLCIDQLDLCRKLAEQAPYDERVEITPLAGHDIISYGLKLKLIERVHHVMGDMIQIAPDQAVLLTYFRNNVLHLYVMASLIAALVRRNGRIDRVSLYAVISTLYPFLRAELFLKWEPEQVEQVIASQIAVLAAQGLLEDDGHFIYAPLPNSAAFGQLAVLATAVEQSLERYLMVTMLLSQQGSGRITSSQLEDLCVLLGQRLSVLYEFHAPEFFERALFRSFIEAMINSNMVWLEGEQGELAFDDRLLRITQNAPLVLSVETLHTIEHLTALTEEEIQAATEALAKRKALRLSRRKAK